MSKPTNAVTQHLLPATQSLRHEWEWTTEQMEYMLWLITPSGVREPRTREVLANKLGVSGPRLWQWQSLPGFGDMMMRLKMDLLKASDTVEVLETLTELAKRGNLSAIRLYFEVVGLLGPMAVYMQQLNLQQAQQSSESPEGNNLFEMVFGRHYFEAQQPPAAPVRDGELDVFRQALKDGG